MAFGDGGNDITMLRHAAIGVAMGQAKYNMLLLGMLADITQECRFSRTGFSCQKDRLTGILNQIQCKKLLSRDFMTQRIGKLAHQQICILLYYERRH